MAKSYAIGIDIGGTSIKFGIVSNQGDILRQNSVETPALSPKEMVLQKLSDVIGLLNTYACEQSISINAIGIGTPGSVDISRGFLIGSTPNFLHWKEVDIAGYLNNIFSLPIFVDNDANLVAFGEYVFGLKDKCKNAVFITLGTGIGGGLIIDGKIYRGSFFAGAELGHMSIKFNGRKCRCGGAGCWEQYASATAMIKEYNDKAPNNKVNNAVQIFQRFHDGDDAAIKIIEQVTDYLGTGLANLINIFNPEKIVMGGGVSEAGDWFIKKVSMAARRRAMTVAQNNVEIIGANLGANAGLLGAAVFALNSLNEQV